MAQSTLKEKHDTAAELVIIIAVPSHSIRKLRRELTVLEIQRFYLVIQGLASTSVLQNVNAEHVSLPRMKS